MSLPRLKIIATQMNFYFKRNTICVGKKKSLRKHNSSCTMNSFYCTVLYCTVLTEEFLPVAGRYIYLKTLSSLNQGCNTGCFKNIKISSAYARSKQIPIGIWEISQMPGYLGNFPNAYCYLRVVYFLDFQMNGNFQDTQAFGEFPKYPDI